MDDRDLKYIDDYLENRLSNSEKTQFQSRLEQEPELLEEFTFRKSAFQFLLKEKSEVNLKKTLNDLGSKHFDTAPNAIQPKKSNNLRFLLLLAAAAVLILLIAKPWSDTDLYSKHGSHTALALVEKSDITTIRQKAEQNFNSGDYANASTSLKAILAEEPSNNKVRMALGICALEQDEYEEAESYFNQLIASDSSFKEYGLWYMALSSLKQNNTKKALSFVDQITALDDPYLRLKKEALMNDLK